MSNDDDCFLATGLSDGEFVYLDVDGRLVTTLIDGVLDKGVKEYTWERRATFEVL